MSFSAPGFVDIYSSVCRKLIWDPMRQRVSVVTTGPIHHCKQPLKPGSQGLRKQVGRIVGDFIGMCRIMGRGNAQAKPESERLSQRLCRLQNHRNLSSPFPPFPSPPQHTTETTHSHMTDSRRTHQPLCWDVFPHCLIFPIVQTRFLPALDQTTEVLTMD